MPLISWIILTTAAAGIGSVWVAEMFVCLASHTKPHRAWLQQGLLSLAAGSLLSTSLIHLMPEALESRVDAQKLLSVFLLGLIFFFVLSKVELWHHAHESSPAGHSHRKGNWSLLLGDGVHCFGDGVLIASIILTDVRLGLIAAASVLFHEVPHHIGDLIVLSRDNRRGMSLIKLSSAGAMTVSGGISGYFLLGSLKHWQPFLMAFAASSFVYIALSDLVPQLNQRASSRDAAAQTFCLTGGVAIVMIMSRVVR